MKSPVKKVNVEVPGSEPVAEKKDWEAIAREIWDDYDTLALFLESHFHILEMQKLFPFLEKVLSHRFRYFINNRGMTLTHEEYAKQKESERWIMDLLMKK